MMDMGFRALLLRARENDAVAMLYLVTKYKPLIIKYSDIDGVVDDDLRQELIFTLIKCVFQIRIF